MPAFYWLIVLNYNKELVVSTIFNIGNRNAVRI